MAHKTFGEKINEIMAQIAIDTIDAFERLLDRIDELVGKKK